MVVLSLHHLLVQLEVLGSAVVAHIVVPRSELNLALVLKRYVPQVYVLYLLSVFVVLLDGRELLVRLQQVLHVLAKFVALNVDFERLEGWFYQEL